MHIHFISHSSDACYSQVHWTSPAHDFLKTVGTGCEAGRTQMTRCSNRKSINKSDDKQTDHRDKSSTKSHLKLYLLFFNNATVPAVIT